MKLFSLPAEPITNVPKDAASLSWLRKDKAVPPFVPDPLKVLFVILASIVVCTTVLELVVMAFVFTVMW